MVKLGEKCSQNSLLFFVFEKKITTIKIKEKSTTEIGGNEKITKKLSNRGYTEI
jgi:hypothetical protein